MTNQLLKSLGQVANHVKDLDTMISFYQETLGLKMLIHVPQMAFFDMGGCRLMLSSLPEPEHDHPASVLYFMVDNIQDVYQTLKNKGVLFEDTPHFIAKEPQGDLWMTFFRDPEHNLLALMSYQP